MAKVIDYGALIQVVPTLPLQQLKKQKAWAEKKVEESPGNPAVFTYWKTLVSAVADANETNNSKATPINGWVTQADVQQIWKAIFHAEGVLTQLNPVGKSGKGKSYVMSRTRQGIAKNGIASWWQEDDSVSSHVPAWHRATWAALAHGGPDCTFEKVVIDNPHRFVGSVVGQVWNQIEATLPIYGYPVPPRPAHATPADTETIRRMRSEHVVVIFGESSADPDRFPAPTTAIYVAEVAKLSWPKERAAALAKAKWKCQHPGCSVVNVKVLHVHHRIHRAQGGSDHHSNLVVLRANHHVEEHLGVETA